jgi:hypothetical protein
MTQANKIVCSVGVSDEVDQNVTVTLLQGTLSDLAGNVNDASKSYTVRQDTTAPDVIDYEASSDYKDQQYSPHVEAGATLTFSFTFNEPVKRGNSGTVLIAGRAADTIEPDDSGFYRSFNATYLFQASDFVGGTIENGLPIIHVAFFVDEAGNQQKTTWSVDLNDHVPPYPTIPPTPPPTPTPTALSIKAVRSVILVSGFTTIVDVGALTTGIKNSLANTKAHVSINSTDIITPPIFPKLDQKTPITSYLLAIGYKQSVLRDSIDEAFSEGTLENQLNLAFGFDNISVASVTVTTGTVFIFPSANGTYSTTGIIFTEDSPSSKSSSSSQTTPIAIAASALGVAIVGLFVYAFRRRSKNKQMTVIHPGVFQRNQQADDTIIKDDRKSGKEAGTPKPRTSKDYQEMAEPPVTERLGALDAILPLEGGKHKSMGPVTHRKFTQQQQQQQQAANSNGNGPQHRESDVEGSQLAVPYSSDFVDTANSANGDETERSMTLVFDMPKAQLQGDGKTYQPAVHNPFRPNESQRSLQHVQSNSGIMYSREDANHMPMIPYFVPAGSYNDLEPAMQQQLGANYQGMPIVPQQYPYPVYQVNMPGPMGGNIAYYTPAGPGQYEPQYYTPVPVGASEPPSTGSSGESPMYQQQQPQQQQQQQNRTQEREDVKFEQVTREEGDIINSVESSISETPFNTALSGMTTSTTDSQTQLIQQTSDNSESGQGKKAGKPIKKEESKRESSRIHSNEEQQQGEGSTTSDEDDQDKSSPAVQGQQTKKFPFFHNDQ